MNLNYKCCGLNGFEDFAKAKKWERNRQEKVTVQSVTVTVNVTLSTPISCCKMKGSFPSADPEEPEVCAMDPVRIDKKGKTVDQVSNRNTGCWNEIVKEREDKKGLIVGVCCGVIGFQVLLIILAIIAYITTRNEKKSKVNYA